MKTAFAVFAYDAPSIATYALECFSSIAAQTDKGFSLVAFNDGMASLKEVISECGVVAEIVVVSGSPASIRRDGIQHLTNMGFEAIVFGDIDDWFDDNRVAVARRRLAAGDDIVVNELAPFGAGVAKSAPMLGDRLHEGEILLLDAVCNGNCLGMSNTAARVAAIPESAFLPKDVVAFDWLFYTRMLEAGARARFTAETRTHYRQHANNTVALDDFSDAQILRSLQIKCQHYSAIGSRRAIAMAETSARLRDDPAIMARYCDAVRVAASDKPFWWEPFKTLDELKL